MTDDEGSIEGPRIDFRLEMAADKLHYDIKVECAEVASRALMNKIWAKAKEAHLEGKNIAVSPMFDASEDRPTILGHYLKLKLNYTFLNPGEEAPAGWTLYNTSEIDPDLVKFSGS